jgi:hypothetical protein
MNPSILTKFKMAFMATLFESFGTKSLFGGGKFVYNINGNPNSPQANKLFFPNLYKFENLYILMDFYLVLSRRACPRSSRPDTVVCSAPQWGLSMIPLGNSSLQESVLVRP